MLKNDLGVGREEIEKKNSKALLQEKIIFKEHTHGNKFSYPPQIVNGRSLSPLGGTHRDTLVGQSDSRFQKVQSILFCLNLL